MSVSLHLPYSLSFSDRREIRRNDETASLTLGPSPTLSRLVPLVTLETVLPRTLLRFLRRVAVRVLAFLQTNARQRAR